MKMKEIKLLDLQAAYAKHRKEIDERIGRVLNHAAFVLGPEVLELEKALAAFTGVRHVVTCSSGTDALLMALMAKGVGPGDAVFTTPFTFIASAEVIARLGARPVFVDIDPVTKNIDPAWLKEKIKEIESQGKFKPRAVIPVDLFGLPADYENINRIAAENGLFVLEDAAQSFGASSGNRRAGALAEIAATSFFPAKPLGCFGDGGAIFTDDENLQKLLLSIRVHGQGETKYDNIRLGLTGRLDTIQAAILLVRLKALPEELESRRRIAAMYDKALKGVVEIPVVPEGYASAWAQYSIESPCRQAILDVFKQENIPCAVYYTKPLHLQKVFADLGHREGDFPGAEASAQRILSLPMHPYLTDEQVHYVADTLVRAVERAGSGSRQ